MNMRSYALCPVSDKTVNERVARVNGVFTLLFLFFYGITQNILPVVFLSADFLLRASDYSKYSLIGISSKGIVRYFAFHENVINAGPKILAARLGFILCNLIIISFFFSSYLPALALAVILGLFSFLEAAFGLCVACEIYPFIYRVVYRVKL